jgi:hypothetical protein
MTVLDWTSGAMSAVAPTRPYNVMCGSPQAAHLLAHHGEVYRTEYPAVNSHSLPLYGARGG